MDLPEYYVGKPYPGDHRRITEIHQQAYVKGHTNNLNGATREALEAYVNGEFADRKRTEWQEAVMNQRGLYVARQQVAGTIVGFGQILASPSGREGVVNALYVHPDHHRRGIGTLLMHAMLQEGDYDTVGLTVTAWAPAVHFYGALGFVVVTRSFPTPTANGIRLEQVAMERSLRS